MAIFGGLATAYTQWDWAYAEAYRYTGPMHSAKASFTVVGNLYTNTVNKAGRSSQWAVYLSFHVNGQSKHSSMLISKCHWMCLKMNGRSCDLISKCHRKCFTCEWRPSFLDEESFQTSRSRSESRFWWRSFATFFSRRSTSTRASPTTAETSLKSKMMSLRRHFRYDFRFQLGCRGRRFHFRFDCLPRRFRYDFHFPFDSR